MVTTEAARGLTKYSIRLVFAQRDTVRTDIINTFNLEMDKPRRRPMRSNILEPSSSSRARCPHFLHLLPTSRLQNGLRALSNLTLWWRTAFDIAAGNSPTCSGTCIRAKLAYQDFPILTTCCGGRRSRSEPWDMDAAASGRDGTFECHLLLWEWTWAEDARLLGVVLVR